MRTPLRHPGRPSRRAVRLAFAGAAVGALLLSAGIVWRSAYASFSDATPNFPVPFATGSVVIGDDDAGSVPFSLSGLKPGAAASRCIAVTSTGTVPAFVRLYGTGKATTRSLSANLTVNIDAGSGGSSTDCSGFTPSGTVYRGTLAAFPTSYAGGVGEWATAGTPPEGRSYRITVSMPANAASTSQAGTAAVSFTWEGQSRGSVK